MSKLSPLRGFCAGLSLVQQRVLTEMAQGWLLERVPPAKKGGCFRLRCGRQFKHVSAVTVRALEIAGVIREVPGPDEQHWSYVRSDHVGKAEAQQATVEA